MPLVLDTFPFQKIEDLCWDMEGFLAVIINAEKVNEKFIKERVDYLKSEYDAVLKPIPLGLSTAMDVILEAFNQICFLEDDLDNLDNLKQNALEIFTSLNAEPEEYLEKDIERTNEELSAEVEI